MKKYSLVKKGAALAVAAAVTLSAGNVALADSHSGAFTIDRGNYVEVLKNGKVKKSNTSGSAAKFTCNMSVGYNDTLNFYVYNKNNNIVSAGPATFRGTSKGTHKTSPYRDGKGLKGNPFYFRCSLDLHSVSSSMKVNYKFIP